MSSWQDYDYTRDVAANLRDAINNNEVNMKVKKGDNMAYAKHEAPIVISKKHRDLLKSLAEQERRPMKTQMEILIEKAVDKIPN